MKIKEFIKRNTTGVIIGAVLFGSITGVVAATALTASDVTYTGNNQTTVKGALDDLYTKANRLDNWIDAGDLNVNGTGGKISFVYWNDNFSKSNYDKLSVPTGANLNGTYPTRSALETAYTHWEDLPFYVKTTKVNGTVTGHTACISYNARDFCIAPNYWETDQATTLAKLKADMESAFGETITNSDCLYYGTGYFGCDIGDFWCGGSNTGAAFCYNDEDEGCTVNAGGTANCSLYGYFQ